AQSCIQANKLGRKKMENLKSIIENEKVKGAIAIIAAVIMFYTPDHIDLLIETLLTAFGITKFVISEKK
ncbi:MAG: hypothetical protein IJ730_00590, partial [Alphaproteobacteria bacterium]|nr:hypothetical protein [Alphaproteobacteria bacterium]